MILDRGMDVGGTLDYVLHNVSPRHHMEKGR